MTTASDVVGTGLVAGFGCSSDAPAEAVLELLAEALDGRVPDLVATLDRRAGLARQLGLPTRTYAADELAAVKVPHPSSAVATAVGTASVAEAAALLAAGPGAELVVPKRKSAVATVAVASSIQRRASSN